MSASCRIWTGLLSYSDQMGTVTEVGRTDIGVPQNISGKYFHDTMSRETVPRVDICLPTSVRCGDLFIPPVIQLMTVDVQIRTQQEPLKSKHYFSETEQNRSQMRKINAFLTALFICNLGTSCTMASEYLIIMQSRE